MIAKVAVENTAFSFDDAFDYAIPENSQKTCVPVFVYSSLSAGAVRNARASYLL